MDTGSLAGHRRRGSLLETTLEEAVHRCIDLASPFGTIELLRPDGDPTREFRLDLGDRRSQRLRWTFKSVPGGTELRIIPQSSLAWLARLGRRTSRQERDLERRLALLPHLLSLRIVVVGGGTGLYTLLCGLRDRTSSLTAIVSGLPRSTAARNPKDELGWLPNDDASMGLVAMAPTVRENLSLRSLLAHRVTGGEFRGAHFGMALLEALTEVCGSRQAALDELVQLLGIRGRVVMARVAGHSGATASVALEIIKSADLFVVAPGHLDVDALPALSCSGMLEAIRDSRALKVMVTNIMSAEDDCGDPTSAYLVKRLSKTIPVLFDVVLANMPAFTERQLGAYAARGARPIVPDVEGTGRYANLVVTRALGARGDLARHDPELLGDSLLRIVTASLVGASRASEKTSLDESLLVSEIGHNGSYWSD